MSLATRCPSCGTVFRVVQDQLRVSEGWVRCGRCNGVFNAAEVLFDIDSGAPMGVDLGLPGAPAAAPPAPLPAPSSALSSAPSPAPPANLPPARSPASAPAWSPPSGPADWVGGRQEPRFDSGPDWSNAPEVDEPLLRAPSRHQDDLADALANEITITDHVPAPGLGAPATAAPAVLPAPLAAQAAGLDDAPARQIDAAIAGSAAAAASAVQAVPSFLRTAERHALWRRPAMRLVAAIGVVALAASLLLQAALLWRDTLAARWPGTAPALTALCRLAGCSVQPLRRIDALSVHSSGLNRLEGSTLYRLQLVLQNRADTAVMMPALDLSLTDPQGKLVSRRVLQVAELGAPQAVLQPGEELPIKALVSTGDRRVDGYTLELFYP